MFWIFKSHLVPIEHAISMFQLRQALRGAVTAPAISPSPWIGSRQAAPWSRSQVETGYSFSYDVRNAQGRKGTHMGKKATEPLNEVLRDLKLDWIDYRSHPSDTVLNLYLVGMLRPELPLPEEVMPDVLSGDLSDEQWTSVLVGAHVKTCKICTKTVSRLRQQKDRAHTGNKFQK
jgi:hypothetical protein